MAGLMLVAVLALAAATSAGAFDGGSRLGLPPYGGGPPGGGGGAGGPCGYSGCPPTPTATATATATATPTPTPASVAPKDGRSPTAAIGPAGKSPRLTKALATGLPFEFTCDEACSIKVELTVDKATARKLGLNRKAKGAVTVARGSAKTFAAGSGSVRAKFTAKAKKALKRAKKVKLRAAAVVSDTAGNAAPASARSVTLKR
jgi:hypothetical protein